MQLRKNLYYAINVLSVLDCLDVRNSDVQYASDNSDEILQVWRYVFHEERIPRNSSVPIFKVRQYLGAVLVTEPFVDVVRKHKLRGASFHDPAANQFTKMMRGESLNTVPGLPTKIGK